MRTSCILMLAACGGSAHHTQDASPPDVATDTVSPATADAPNGAVTLAVTLNGAPAPNVIVYFQSADSALVLAAATDSHGTVGATLAAGGFVTAIEPADGSGITKLDTFAAVRPGDALHLDVAPASTPTPVSFQLTVPIDTAAKVTGYHVYTQCGDALAGSTGTTPVTLAGCGTQADMLVTSLDDQSNIIDYFFVPGIAISSAPVTLTGTYMPPVPTAFSYMAVPPTVTFVGTTQQLRSAQGSMFDATTGAVPANAAASDGLAQPATSEMIALTVTDCTPDTSQHGEQLVYDWDAWTNAYVLDLSTVLLPAYASDASYDTASHAVTWTENEGGATPDLSRATLHVYRDAIPQGTTWTWSIVGPRGTSTRLAYPTLPVGGGFDFNAAATDTTSVSDLTTVKLPGGYDAFRAHGFAPVRGAIAGSKGTIVVQLPYSAPL